MFTLSFYDQMLKEMVRLATIEIPYQEKHFSETFFKGINKNNIWMI